MLVLEIDITDIEDAKIEKNKAALESILGAIENVLAASGQVILKRSYCTRLWPFFRPIDLVSD